MFCKYCGKGIEEDSTYCKYCGKDNKSQKGIISKPVWIIYLIWSFSHLYLLMGCKSGQPASYFYPFTAHKEYFGFESFREYYMWDKYWYDYSEFIVYVFILPAILFIVYKYKKRICNIIKESWKMVNKKLKSFQEWIQS